jgi:pyruvate kinase
MVGKPVITATQMLDSMIRNPRPTRAETTDVANAIFDGTDAIMLSGETAAGKYPLESVRVMDRIAKAAESSLDYKKMLKERANEIVQDGVTFAVSHATATTANELEAKAIITATSSGFTARKISMFRPKSPIIAACISDDVVRKLNLVWGVEAIKVDYVGTTDEIFYQVEKEALNKGYIESGDLIVITAGVPVGVAGATNLMKIHIVDELLVKGVGIGNFVVTQRACIVKNERDAQDNFMDGDIIITDSLEKELIPYVKRSSGLVTEEGGYTSPGALVAINLGIPALVGARNATDILRNGTLITLDAKKNLIYSGKTRIL